MRSGARKVMIILVALVFAGSCGMVGYRQYEYHIGNTDYSQAQEMAGVPDISEAVLPEGEDGEAEEPDQAEEPEKPVWVDPYAEELKNMDFAALREVNDEVRGWILIPGTYISYPLMQADNNDKYLKTTWRGSRSSVGSIFLEHRNSSDLSDFNTMIYGHRTVDGSMFGSLKNYSKQSWWKARPYVYITDDEGCKTYAIFAAYEAGVTDDTYRLSFADETEKQKFIDFCLEKSVIDTGVTPDVNSRVITLSTCTGRGYETRWVVQAVLI